MVTAICRKPDNVHRGSDHPAMLEAMIKAKQGLFGTETMNEILSF
jgi:hypothetical protein